MRHPSASNAEAFLRCGVSHIAPQHEAYLARTENGTAGHEMIRAWREGEPGAAAALEKAWPGITPKLEALFDGVTAVRMEPAFVVDMKKRTSTFLGNNIGRKYEELLGRPLEKYEVPTSLDAHGVRGNIDDCQNWIRDWKFGIHSSQLQLEIQAMAVLWCVPKDRQDVSVDAGFVYIEGREDDTFVHEEQQTLYLMDLDAKAEALCNAFDRVYAMQKELDQGFPYQKMRTVEGSWCTYCGAYPSCPSKWALARAMDTGELDMAAKVGMLTLEQCGTIYQRAKEFEKKVLGPTVDAIKRRLEVEGPAPLANGKRLKLIQMPGRESLDKQYLVGLLLEKGATQEEIARAFTPGKPYYQVKEGK